MSRVIYPLKVNKGTSRYHSGDHWYLVDAEDKLIAGTNDHARANLFTDLVDLTTALVQGEAVDIEVSVPATTTITTVRP